jgi:hypothetical protein
MTPMDHAETIKAITKATSDIPEIRGLYLSGSFGNGMSDQYSDIDFILVSTEGATDTISKIWRNAVNQTGDVVLWRDRKPNPVLINAITDNWMRTDVIILKPDQTSRYAQSTLKPLFDHDGIYEGLIGSPKVHGPNVGKFKYQIEEFIRILGLLHLAVGREEYINGVLGVFLLRNLLVDLLIETTGAPNRGGVLHLNRLITDEQKELLTSLPPAIPEREAMISTHIAYAKEYLPLARKRAAQIDVDWPERFEEVTWSKLNEALAVDRPY